MTASPRRALIVIDVQNEYFTGALPIAWPPVALSLPNITRAMDAARAAGIAVIVVQHDAPADAPVFARGSHGWQLHPEIAARPADLTMQKSDTSAFAGTDLARYLAEQQIDTLTIAGYMTHNCDAATIYEAAQAGFKVEFLADASGALPYANTAGQASAEEIHRVYCTVLHTGFAAVAQTVDWLAAVHAGQALAADNIVASNQRARTPA